jgi:N-formylglutamate amidohydrolase
VAVDSLQQCWHHPARLRTTSDVASKHRMPLTSFDLSGKPPFEVVMPEAHTLPLVFNSPHSGSLYPEPFLAASRLDKAAIRRSEDFCVDELMTQAVALGAPLLKANFPRAWLDVNREPYELDPKMFDGTLPPYANVRSVRVAGGGGPIARIVSESEEIYAAPLPVDEALSRIEAVYKPYHRMLRDLVLSAHAEFGVALLLDCHSMPSSVRGASARHRPDIVIGDRYGTSAAPELTDIAAEILARLGYAVSRNKPYAGGFITEHYGQPLRGIHAMQVEINRSLYMDERSLERTGGFARLAGDLARLADGLAVALDARLPQTREAAE